MQMEARLFESMVEDALDALPAEVHQALQNVAFFVEDRNPDEPDLLGVYDGVDLTERGEWYSGSLPDRIVLYREAHLDVCRDLAELRHEIATTLKHEIAHYFGIDHARMHDLGLD